MDINEAINTLVKLGRLQGAQIEATDPQSATGTAGHVTGVYHLIVPDGMSATDITDKVLATMDTPRRRRNILKMLSLTSLVEVVNRYNEGHGTVIFANTENRKLTAIFDYHHPLNVFGSPNSDLGSDADEADNAWVCSPVDAISPGWAFFRASYEFPLSRQWKLWGSIDGSLQSQNDLALFIEDNIRDIADPEAVTLPDSLKLLINRLHLQVGSPAKLLEVARGLEIKSAETVRQMVNTDTGEQVISYEQTHAQGGNATVTELRVPTAFLLTIPVFQNDAPYLLLARLRYRKVGGGVNWIINIQGAEAALEDAFDRACKQVEVGTGKVLLRGVEPAASVP